MNRSFFILIISYTTGCVSATSPRPASAEDFDGLAEGIALRTQWVEETERKQIEPFDIAYTNQDGQQGMLRSLADRPTLITFFYTRCQNNYKCSAALTRFTALQQELEKLGLDDDVRLLAITYEPAFDDSVRLKRFGADRGLKFSKHAQALRLDEQHHEALIRSIKAPVSLSGGAVNTHGVGLHVLDASGRLARQYHTLLWNNAQVVQDVKRLLAEEQK